MRLLAPFVASAFLSLLVACAADTDESEQELPVVAPETSTSVELQKIKEEMCACKDKACSERTKVLAARLGATDKYSKCDR